MRSNRQAIKRLAVFACALALVGLAVGGCAKKGSSGLTFYEFFDPT